MSSLFSNLTSRFTSSGWSNRSSPVDQPTASGHKHSWIRHRDGSTSRPKAHSIPHLHWQFSQANLTAPEEADTSSNFPEEEAIEDVDDRQDDFQTEELKNKVDEVLSTVTKIWQSFGVVAAILDDLDRHSCEVIDASSDHWGKKSNEWNKLKTEFETIIRVSREKARQQSVSIKDFSDRIVPYLKDEQQDMGQKKEEVRHFSDKVKEFKDRAANYNLTQLDSLCDRIREFKTSLLSTLREYIEKKRDALTARFEQLESEMENLRKGFGLHEKNVWSQFYRELEKSKNISIKADDFVKKGDSKSRTEKINDHIKLILRAMTGSSGHYVASKMHRTTYQTESDFHHAIDRAKTRNFEDLDKHRNVYQAKISKAQPEIHCIVVQIGVIHDVWDLIAIVVVQVSAELEHLGAHNNINSFVDAYSELFKNIRTLGVALEKYSRPLNFKRR